MSLRNRQVLSRLVLPVILSSLAVLAGCGSSNNAVAPPTGAFSNTDFSGTYTFSSAGQDVNGAFVMAGSLTACGCTGGTISGGTVDFDDASGIAPGSTIGTNSTYNITADGRGTARLFITTTASVALPEVDVDFVLTSSSHGLITRYDTSGTGSGTIDLQPAAVSQSAVENNPYAFSISGSFNGVPLATVGAFTLGSSGTVSTGIEDFNEGGAPSTSLPITAGSLTIGSGTTPGTGTFTTAFGQLNFDVYAIDATHLKLIESDGIALLVGDVFTQPSATIPQGNLVFTMQGLDTATPQNEFAAGGLMASDGNSLITSGSEDVNDGGFVDNGTNPAVPFGFSGNFSTVGGGRFLLNLTGYAGGTSFAAYPSSGGILLLEVDTGLNVGSGNAGVTSGIALAQSSGAGLTASQGYGLNLTGEDVVDEVELDEIAEFQTTSTALTPGILDENDGFTLSSSSINGTYTAGSNGAGSATVNGNLQEVFYYAADSSTVLFISVDPNQAALGSMEVQVAPSSAAQSGAVRARSLPMQRVIPHSHSKSGAHVRVRLAPANQSVK
jgi:hypothetical protein